MPYVLLNLHGQRRWRVGSHRHPRLKDVSTDVLNYSTSFRINLLLTWTFLSRMLQGGYSQVFI